MEFAFREIWVLQDKAKHLVTLYLGIYWDFLCRKMQTKKFWIYMQKNWEKSNSFMNYMKTQW